MDEVERKVTATCRLLPGAEPTNKRWTDERTVEAMELHRALWRGRGFGDLMRHRSSLSMGPPQALRSIPRVSLVSNDRHQALHKFIFAMDAERDRIPYRNYLSSRPLGLGIINAVRARYPSTHFDRWVLIMYTSHLGTERPASWPSALCVCALPTAGSSHPALPTLL